MRKFGQIVLCRLTGRRVRLEPFEECHITANYINWLNDPVVNAYSQRRGAQTTLDDARRYMAGLRSNEIVLAILTDDHGHVGNVKFGPIDWPNACADISILIGEKAVWGRGYGSEAIYVVSRYLIKELDLNRVYADSCNPAFLKMVARLGWKVEGVLRERVRLGEKFIDDTIVSLLASEFQLIDAFETAPRADAAHGKTAHEG